jgi:uncharacterized protein (TIGR02246 family)
MIPFHRSLASVLLVIAAFALASKLAAQAPAGADSAAVPESVRAMIDSVNAAWIPQLQRKDAAGIAAPYADDGMLVTPTGETFRGRAAVEEAMRTSLARLGTAQVSGRLVQDGITRVGTLIYEWGHAELEISRPGGQPAHSNGRYLTVWQQDSSGRWRILRNLSLP